MKSRASLKIIYTDSFAGISVGVFTLIFWQFLANLYSVSGEVIILVGTMNVLYGCFAFRLLNYKRRTITSVRLLAKANFLWVLCCVVLFTLHLHKASVWGLMHFAIEALFVGLLALLEWQNQENLTSSKTNMPATQTRTPHKTRRPF